MQIYSFLCWQLWKPVIICYPIFKWREKVRSKHARVTSLKKELDLNVTIRGIPYLFLENCLSRFTTTGFGSGNFRRDGIEQQITYALFLSIPVDCLLIDQCVNIALWMIIVTNKSKSTFRMIIMKLYNINNKKIFLKDSTEKNPTSPSKKENYPYH